jgi:Protein of unknown function (DUF1553)/Protein of unknown function (DUF1549)/Planctomycete cytochrome C
MRTVLCLALLIFGTPFASRAQAKDPVAPDVFSSAVRPILARHCFKCHGPDVKTRKASLRLDVRSEAVKPTKSGTRAIVPGRPEDSEIVSRIFAEADDELMPPPEAKLPLKDEEKQVLKRWIADGAGYTAHWSFVAPRPASLPEVRQTEWPRNAIDAFVLARLEREGLTPSPRADRSTLIRRLSLDLIGLPPTPEEVDAFVGDESPDAYEALVDRLLASPHYGERWARRWLDLARYADTNGYEKDRARLIWPYRDWVIESINADMPFDRFTIEQLAGDMLPGNAPGPRIATGFHRNTMLNEEGGIDPLEFRYYAMTDRVATTATAWLGLTLGCAQCHTHKYDPIPHREYYQFMALLNNADEPVWIVPQSDASRRRAEIERLIATRFDDLPNHFPAGEKRDEADARSVGDRRKDHLEGKFREWVASEEAKEVSWTPLRPVEANANIPSLIVEEDGTVFASGDQSKRDIYTLKFQSELSGVTAVRLEALPDARLPDHGPGRVYYEGTPGDFFLSDFRISTGGKSLLLKSATHSSSGGKAESASAAIDEDPQTGWSIGGGQGKAHWAVFNLAAPIVGRPDFEIRLLFERYYAAGLGRFRISVTSDGRAVEARGVPPEIERILMTPAAERTSEQNRQLMRQFLEVAPELSKEREAIEKLRKTMPDSLTTLVMEERPPSNPRPTFVHNRGEYLQPTDRVEPAVLSILPSLPTDAPRDRLALARWLVSPDNPLTGRVVMNRQWAAFFGKGIVRTLEDFGYQGEPPTHPELLDWLALEFVRQGWSMKAMHKRIVMSATYQQSSHVSPALLAKDQENRLLARGSRVRLEAEQIRDQALLASGLLSRRIGGPSVFPSQPPGVTSEGTYGGLNWKPSDGGDRFRRGLYTFSKRTAPYAAFTTFDAPSGEVCVARREISNTPLQALTLLNDTVFQDAAQALGRQTAALPGAVETKIAALFRRCLSRAPDPSELATLLQFHRAQKERLDRKELDAAAVAGPGEGDVQERAVWTMIARAILNLDETVTKG